MSKRLPLCAYCGRSLRFSGETKDGRVMLEWAGLKGHPMVGWLEIGIAGREARSDPVRIAQKPALGVV